GGMTRAEALAELTQQIPNYPMPAVSLYRSDQQWLLQQASLRVAPDFLSAVNQAYLVGRERRFLGRLGQQVLALVGGINIMPPLRYDQTQLQQFVFAVADEASQPGRPARQLGDLTIPAEAGIRVDVGATTTALMAALNGAPTTAVHLPLVVTEFTPQATDAEATSAGEAVPETAAPGSLAALPLGFSPLRLVDEQYDIDMALDPVFISQLMKGGAAMQLDESALRTYLAGLAEQLDIAPHDARLRFNPATGGVTVLQESHNGRQLDIAATVASIRDALANQQAQATLVLTEVPPAVDMNRIAEMGIRELIASGDSYFRGSSAARVRNIEVAAEKFDGLVIPPGEIFSFNTGVEDVTAANGFEDSLVIMGDTTAVGVGGGVCQVSTTIFRAAYSAGFPIVERYNHGYVVSWYGEPGLDATIYTPTVDFRFLNDTGAYLLIEP
ncbi:MAG: VanW family protein, partial [Caldilineaceae bacterium]|nr:VanW family protein [Caldilineaceae bacterium]